MQRVQFFFGQAALTPPISCKGEFLIGERITLAGQEFVVARPPAPDHAQSAAPSPTGVRRVPVVELSAWRQPVIDRGYTWPPAKSRPNHGQAA